MQGHPSTLQLDQNISVVALFSAHKKRILNGEESFLIHVASTTAAQVQHLTPKATMHNTVYKFCGWFFAFKEQMKTKCYTIVWCVMYRYKNTNRNAPPLRSMRLVSATTKRCFTPVSSMPHVASPLPAQSHFSKPQCVQGGVNINELVEQGTRNANFKRKLPGRSFQNNRKTAILQ